MPIFAIPLRKNGIALSLKNFAEIAQLVEHNLAKVGVASSSLVFRSGEEITFGWSLFFVEKGLLRDSNSRLRITRLLPEGSCRPGPAEGTT